MLAHTSSGLSRSAPTLWVTLGDLQIPVAVPSLDLTEQFLEKSRAVSEFKDGLTQDAYDDIFAFFAELLSCNYNYVRFTPEDLKQRRVTVSQIIDVLADWANFIGTLASLKN